MTHRRGATSSARSFAAEVAIDLVRHDVPDATPGEIGAAADHVDASLAALPELTRLGFFAASGAAYLALSVLGRSPYRRQDQQTRSRNAARLAGARVPVIVEFSRLTRGLALVGLFEHRTREEILG